MGLPQSGQAMLLEAGDAQVVGRNGSEAFEKAHVKRPDPQVASPSGDLLRDIPVGTEYDHEGLKRSSYGRAAPRSRC